MAVPAGADGPGLGTPWIVTLGDSSISGEAGRWAGNTNTKLSEVDALGSTAYYDNALHTAELIPGCHRAQSAEVYIGNGVLGENLACSGAKTLSYTASHQFKPGLDFFNSAGDEGQALMLEKFAKLHNVTLVPIAIGANNFNFAEILGLCVERFALSEGPCSNQLAVTNNFTAKNIETQTTEIKEGVLHVSEAMKNAGYTTSQYTILVQNYASPIPDGTEIRYPETVAKRQEVGGCGLYNLDALAANQEMLVEINKAEFTAAEDAKLSNLKTLNIASAFNGRRLCEKGVGLLEEEGLSSWKEPEAVNKTEWVSMIRTPFLAPLTSSFYLLQEDAHPNYWGQLALRDCLTKAYNGGKPIGGTCTIEEEGLNASGEPKMSLSTWTKTATANPSHEVNELGEVSCWSAGNCVAVGQYLDESDHKYEPLVERLSAGTWTVETAPLPAGASSGVFNGISCPTKEFCMASGWYASSKGADAFAYEYTSTGGWEELSPSLPGTGQSELDRVSCPTSAMCMMVGVYELFPGERLPYAQKWTSAHGSTVEYLPGASEGVLIGVSCVTAEECMAVGWTNKAVLADEWSGGTWTQTKSASSSYSPVALRGVDCVTTALVGGCTGVGAGTSSGTELAVSEGWTTTGGWVTAGAQDPSITKDKLWAVGCWERSKCIGVGEENKSPKEAALIERLEGPWSTVEIPATVTGAENSKLGGISCLQERSLNCVTVGWLTSTSGPIVTLAEGN